MGYLRQTITGVGGCRKREKAIKPLEKIVFFTYQAFKN